MWNDLIWYDSQLYSNQLSLTGCSIGTIETAAVSGSGISDVILHNNRYYDKKNRLSWWFVNSLCFCPFICSILSIKGKAITLTSITTLIQGNNISLTEIFWFRVEGWSTVAIENNHFGVYERMGVEITKSPIKCIFENNYITKTVADSLNFKSPHCRVRQVSFDRACSCNSTFFRQLAYNDISAEVNIWFDPNFPTKYY